MKTLIRNASRFTLAVLILLISLPCLSCPVYEVEVSVDPTRIPRDSSSSATVTVTVTDAGTSVGVADVDVDMSVILGGEHVSLGCQVVTTNSSGTGTVSVNSVDVGEEDCTARIQANAEGYTGTADLTLAGLNIDISSDYDKLYVGNESWRILSGITVDAYYLDSDDTHIPATGNIQIDTTMGTLDAGGTSVTKNLISGSQSAILRVGDAGGAALVQASKGSVSNTVTVLFAVQTGFKEQHEPNKKASESCQTGFEIFDQYGQYWPGATVTFHWGVPKADGTLNVFTHEAETSTGMPVPPADSWCSDGSGAAQKDGFGTAQATSVVAGTTYSPHWEKDSDWVDKFLSNGTIINADWQNDRDTNKWKYTLNAAGLVHLLLKLL